jgi:hypothetical protein
MIALYILASIFVYLVGVGYSIPKIYNYCYSRDGLDWQNDASAWSAAFGGIFFPLTLPIFIGVLVSKHKFEPRENRVSRKQAKEIKAAEHRKELALINAETIAIQEKEAGIR